MMNCDRFLNFFYGVLVLIILGLMMLPTSSSAENAYPGAGPVHSAHDDSGHELSAYVYKDTKNNRMIIRYEFINKGAKGILLVAYNHSIYESDFRKVDLYDALVGYDKEKDKLIVGHFWENRPDFIDYESPPLILIKNLLPNQRFHGTIILHLPAAQKTAYEDNVNSEQSGFAPLYLRLGFLETTYNTYMPDRTYRGFYPELEVYSVENGKEDEQKFLEVGPLGDITYGSKGNL